LFRIAPVLLEGNFIMMPNQIELVQSSFELIKQDIESAVMLFYDRLFHLDPSLRHMFRNSREEQARKLAHVLTVVVKGLSRPEQILPAVEELGRRHANYGVRPEHYATVGAALLWTLQAGLGEHFTPEVREAWTSAYLLLSSTMQRAVAEAGTVGVLANAQHA
jgi:hemoglobin-like flavoprotein